MGGLGWIRTRPSQLQVTAKNGKSLLILRDRFILAAWAKKLESAKNDAAQEAATVAAAAATAAKEQPVDQGPDVPALARAAGYGAWPRSLLPTRPTLPALKNATRGGKGSPVPWADPKMDPWFNAKWPKGSKDGSVDTLTED